METPNSGLFTAREMFSEEGLTVDRDEVIQCPGSPVLADRGDALWKESKDWLK